MIRVPVSGVTNLLLLKDIDGANATKDSVAVAGVATLLSPTATVIDWVVNVKDAVLGVTT